MAMAMATPTTSGFDDLDDDISYEELRANLEAMWARGAARSGSAGTSSGGSSSSLSSSEEKEDSDDEEITFDYFRNSSEVRPARRPTAQRPKRPRYDPQALGLLTTITGETATNLQKLLYIARLVSLEEPERRVIEGYVKNGKGHGFHLEVLNVIRIVRNKDPDFPPPPHNPVRTRSKRKNKDANFRMMLWHGTKKLNLIPILTNGLAKPLTTGQMFGPGIYFADVASKSANFCDGTTVGTEGFLFLCDVKVGRMYKVGKARSFSDTPDPKKYDSIKCCGRKKPDLKTSGIKQIKGVFVPSGKLVENKQFENYPLNLSEYIVFDPAKVKIQYLVHFKVHAAPLKN